MKYQIFFLFFFLFPIGVFAACNIVNGEAYGDCAGVVINTKVEFLNVSGNESASNIISGANIKSGGSLFLSGISEGDITVEKGGKLTVTGIVSGRVTNKGGKVNIDGKVDSLYIESGDTEVSGIVDYTPHRNKLITNKGAVVNGIPSK